MIEDKRKFDIMEFVSCIGGEGSEGVGRTKRGEERGERGPTSDISPAHVVH